MRHLLACPATDGFGCRCEELRAARATPGADDDVRALDAAYTEAERFDRARADENFRRLAERFAALEPGSPEWLRADEASRRLAERFAALEPGSPEWLALDAECAAAEAEAEAEDWANLDRYAGDRR